MLKLTGSYFNGKVSLENFIATIKPVRVIVTFQEDIETENNSLKLSDFSFLETQEMLKDYKGSFSNEVIAERRSAL